MGSTFANRETPSRFPKPLPRITTNRQFAILIFSAGFRLYFSLSLPQKSVTERRYGFAAGCEAALGAAVKCGACQRATPSVLALPKRFNHLGPSPSRGHSPITTYDLSGEAKPRLTSGGKAVATITFEARPSHCPAAAGRKVINKGLPRRFTSSSAGLVSERWTLVLKSATVRTGCRFTS